MLLSSSNRNGLSLPYTLPCKRSITHSNMDRGYRALLACKSLLRCHKLSTFKLASLAGHQLAKRASSHKHIVTDFEWVIPFCSRWWISGLKRLIRKEDALITLTDFRSFVYKSRCIWRKVFHLFSRNLSVQTYN